MGLKLVLLTVVASLLFVGFSVFAAESQKQSLADLKRSLLVDRQGRLLAQYQHDLETFAQHIDYLGEWDEFALQVKQPSPDWFEANIRPGLKATDSDTLVTLDPAYRVISTHHRETTGEFIEPSFVADWISDRLGGSSLLRTEGYAWSKGSLVEIAATRIRGVNGTMPNSGYFVAVRYLTGDRLRLLETASRSAILPSQESVGNGFKDDGRYTVSVQLKGSGDEAPVAYLVHNSSLPAMSVLVAQTQEQGSAFIFFALLTSTVMLAGLGIWVLKPLRRIECRIAGTSTEPLNPRAMGSREWVLLADLVNRYEVQHDVLSEAVNELEHSNAELCEMNATLEEHVIERTAELQKAYEATILGWSRAMEFRDEETEGHTQRVADMSLKLGAHFGLSDEELHNLYIGALLHDIGKIGIPDSILLKEGKLTPDEFRVMESHTLIAQEMLEPIKFLKDSMDVPLFHHEKWNGMGYPYGLQSEEIPLLARIFAVSDVWDALRSNRPYRKAWPESRVRDYIKSESGQHFDPRVVDAFLTMEPMAHPSDVEFPDDKPMAA